MSKQETKELLGFLEPFDDRIVEIAMWLRAFVWDLYPECNELIYDNYNAVAVGWSPTEKIGDIFCSFAVFNNKNAHFGFYWGSKLTDPKKILLGEGKQYRYIRVAKKSDFPAAYIKKLLKEAYANSLASAKAENLGTKGATITKSISPKKKRPGDPPKKKKK